MVVYWHNFLNLMAFVFELLQEERILTSLQTIGKAWLTQ